MAIVSPPSRPPRLARGKIWLFRCVALLFSLAVGLGLAEVAARWLQLVPPVQPEADTAIVLYYTDPNGLIKLNPGWEGYVGFVKTEINANGFRDRIYTPQPPPGTVRVVVLGDSYTMGDAVPLEATYAKRLEAMLGERHRVEVMNCGVSATNTANQYEILKEVMHDYHPHLVILSYNVNDFQWYPETRFERLVRAGYNYTVQPDGRVRLSRDFTLPQKAKLWMRNHSYLYRWLANVWDSWAKKDHAPTDYDHVTRVRTWAESPGFAKSFEALGKIRQLCDDQGVPLLVVILPGLLDMPPTIANMDDYPYRKEHERMHEQMRACGVEFIDLLPDFAGQPTRPLEAHPFDRHYSAFGNELIARAVLKHLEPRVAALEQRIGGQ